MSLPPDTGRKLRAELDRLRTSVITYRAGVVTAIAPLAVDIGGSGISVTPIACLRGRSMVVGDKVAVASIGGRNLIVLGVLDTDPDAGAIRPLVTTLPTTGLVDGQEVYLQTAAMATDGLVWHLRYRAAAATFKWEFIGGSPLAKSASTAQAITSTLVNDATLSLQLPRAGTYRLAWSVQANTAATAGYVSCYLNVGGTAGPARFAISPVTSYTVEAVEVADIRASVAANATAILQYQTGSAGWTGGITNRSLVAWPIRVS